MIYVDEGMKSSMIFTTVKKMLIIIANISNDNDDDNEKKGWVWSPVIRGNLRSAWASIHYHSG